MGCAGNGVSAARMAILGVVSLSLPAPPRACSGDTRDTGQECRDSTPPLGQRVAPAEAHGEEATRHRGDFDGDGTADEIVLTHTGGSGTAADELTATLGNGRSRIRVSSEVDFSRLLNVIPVPDALLSPPMQRLREVVESLLFATVCPAPDPSLERLLEAGRPLRWYEGMPALPATYAVLSARPDHLALVPHLTLRPKAVWLLYLGQNHARSDSGALDLHEPRTLADCDDHRVLGTAHGVIALDRTRGKYAWLYVSPGGHKLRWPSIRAARCVDRGVEVVLAEGPADEPGVRPATLQIDLDSGQVRSNDAPADRVRQRRAPRLGPP